MKLNNTSDRDMVHQSRAPVRSYPKRSIVRFTSSVCLSFCMTRKIRRLSRIRLIKMFPEIESYRIYLLAVCLLGWM